jgi:hypothetical protein
MSDFDHIAESKKKPNEKIRNCLRNNTFREKSPNTQNSLYFYFPTLIFFQFNLIENKKKYGCLCVLCPVSLFLSAPSIKKKNKKKNNYFILFLIFWFTFPIPSSVSSIYIPRKKKKKHEMALSLYLYLYISSSHSVRLWWVRVLHRRLLAWSSRGKCSSFQKTNTKKNIPETKWRIEHEKKNFLFFQCFNLSKFLNYYLISI